MVSRTSFFISGRNRKHVLMTREEFIDNLRKIGFSDLKPSELREVLIIKYKTIRFIEMQGYTFIENGLNAFDRNIRRSSDVVYRLQPSEPDKVFIQLTRRTFKEINTLQDIILYLASVGYPEFLLKNRFNKLSKI